MKQNSDKNGDNDYAIFKEKHWIYQIQFIDSFQINNDSQIWVHYKER